MTSARQVPLDTMQRIELAEGVEVELRPAGPMVRAVAWTIDMLWFILILIALSILVSLIGRILGGKVEEGTTMILYFLAYWGYKIYFEAGRHGATPGKRRMGLRVVAESGAPAGFGAVVLRNVARTADFMPFAYFAGLLTCLFTKRFQRLGDLVARTLVVYTEDGLRIPAQRPAVNVEGAEPPPVALTREERGAVVRFWERAGFWSDGRKEELANHATGLTRRHGRDGVLRLWHMARWLRDS